MLYEDVYVGQNICLMEDLTDLTDSYYRCLSLPIGTYGVVVSLDHKGVHREVGVDWDVQETDALHSIGGIISTCTGFYVKAAFIEPVEEYMCDNKHAADLF